MSSSRQISCSPPNACAVVKPHINGAKPEVFRGDELNPGWDTKRSYDKPVVRELLDALNAIRAYKAGLIEAEAASYPADDGDAS